MGGRYGEVLEKDEKGRATVSLSVRVCVCVCASVWVALVVAEDVVMGDEKVEIGGGWVGGWARAWVGACVGGRIG